MIKFYVSFVHRNPRTCVGDRLTVSDNCLCALGLQRSQARHGFRAGSQAWPVHVRIPFPDLLFSTNFLGKVNT